MRPLPIAFALLAIVLSPIALFADHESGEVHGTVDFSTTCAPTVEARFERAVAQLHSFGYEHARAGFETVLSDDPGCAMAAWGVAMTYYHPLWVAPTPAELAAGRAAAERAVLLAAGGAPRTAPISDRERGWVAAVAAFYADSEHADHRTRSGRLRDALADLAVRFPDDHEATIFRALLLLGTASPQDRTYAQQRQAVELLTPLVALHPDHPGVAHYLIHSLDYPELAHLALDAARRYARIAPSSAHALHMPSHIFVRLGLWPESIASNLDSAGSAERYRALFPETSAFDALHALDYLEYAYLQTGQDEAARAVLERITHGAQLEAPSVAAVYALAAIPARHALERGDWRAAAALADLTPAALVAPYPYAEAIPVFGRGVGAAKLGDLAAAERELARLQALQAKLAAAPPPGPYDWAGHVESLRLGVAGLLARARGADAEALRLLAEATAVETRVGKHPVTPGTVLPLGELYADLLLELGRAGAALDAYESTLLVAPNRLRSLVGAAHAADLAGAPERARTLFTLVASIAAPDSRRPEVVAARARIAAR